MKKINFTILGNHKSQTGNPMPKLKMTGKQHWTPRAQEYVAWKNHVVSSFGDTLKYCNDLKEKIGYATNISRYKKPFVLKGDEYVFMQLFIEWSNKAHGDGENIFGSIADALFKNDKNLDGSFFTATTITKLNGKPRACVVVDIWIFDDELEKTKFISKHII